MSIRKFRVPAVIMSLALMFSPVVASATEPTPDTTAPRLLVKPGLTESCPTDVAKTQSFALRDNVGVKGTWLNGTWKGVTPNKFSDYNGIMVGKGGAVDGSNTLVVEDTSGNKSAPCTFVLDGTGPLISVRSAVGSGGVYQKVSYGFTEQRSKVDGYSVNGKVFDLTDNKYSNVDNLTAGHWSGTREGENVLKVWDIFGNVSSITFVIDKTAPAISWVTPNEDSFLRGTVPITASVTDDNPLAYNLRVNSAGLSYANPYASGDQTFQWDTTTIADGRHKLYAAATDRATNKSEAFRFVTVDNTKPALTLPQNVIFGKATQTLHVTQDEANPAKTYVEIQQLVDNKWKKFSGEEYKDTNALDFTVDPLALGLQENVKTQLKVSTWDKAGNHTSQTSSIAVDYSKVQVSITSPNQGDVICGAVTISADFTDNVALKSGVANVYSDGTLLKSLGSKPLQGTSDSETWTADLADGTYLVKVGGTDIAGNSVTVATVTFTVDCTPIEPEVPVDTPSEETPVQEDETEVSNPPTDDTPSAEVVKNTPTFESSGSHKQDVRSVPSAQMVSKSIPAFASAPVATTQLADTGANNVWGAALIIFALLGGGVALMWISRRKNKG